MEPLNPKLDEKAIADAIKEIRARGFVVIKIKAETFTMQEIKRLLLEQDLAHASETLGTVVYMGIPLVEDDDVHVGLVEIHDTSGISTKVQALKEEPRLVHDYFELTYAQYLVIPRSILQSMPEKWQRIFVSLLDALDDTFNWRRSGVWVRIQDKDGWQIVRDEFADYERGRREITPEEADAITARHDQLYQKGVHHETREKGDIIMFNEGAEYGAENMIETVVSVVDEEIDVHQRLEPEGMSKEYKEGFIKGLEQVRSLLNEIDVAETLNP